MHTYRHTYKQMRTHTQRMLATHSRSRKHTHSFTYSTHTRTRDYDEPGSLGLHFRDAVLGCSQEAVNVGLEGHIQLGKDCVYVCLGKR